MHTLNIALHPVPGGFGGLIGGLGGGGIVGIVGGGFGTGGSGPAAASPVGSTQFTGLLST